MYNSRIFLSWAATVVCFNNIYAYIYVVKTYYIHNL